MKNSKMDCHERLVSSSEARDEVLIQVQKPARYIGNEVNAVIKELNGLDLHMALCFPDVYEVGMSHMGLKILYSIVNSRLKLYAERVFAPWPDMEGLMRRDGSRLSTLETGTPLADVDIVGFSLQYELCATAVLQMLDLAGIPLRSADRGEDDPLVIAGGPAAFNPVPMAVFFDAFVMGDGEEVILELADTYIEWKKRVGSRRELLQSWNNIPGVYVPSLPRPGETVARRITKDLDSAEFPVKLVVPFCETVHDRVGMEVARGCTRGCRFCQAGMLYRPVRERTTETIMEFARQNLGNTGWEEIALLSLSTGDYSRIGWLIQKMVEELGPERIAVSLPSLRTDTFDPSMAEQIRKVRKTGFTLAPEAGTDRLRRVINKGNTEEDLEKAVASAFQLGWQSVKLYFMIGLPYETDEDLDGIIGLIRKASKWARGGKITASVSTFVPKCHTPFQWAGQISREDTLRKQQHIKRFFRKGNAQVKFHDPRVSFLEGVIARGDERLSAVIQRAFEKGARFDGWDDQLKFDLWMEAFKEEGIDPEHYLEPREVGGDLPWGMVDTGISPEYLIEEWNRAKSEQATPDCRFGECAGCGVCNFDDILPRLSTESVESREPQAAPGLVEDKAENIRRFRLQYAKLGQMRFLGHQDLIRLFARCFRRARIRLDYSKGFHPHPRLRFSPPLALGVESLAEFLDFDLINSDLGAQEIEVRLLKKMPDGIKPLNLQEILLNDPHLSARIQQFSYRIELLNSLEPEEVEQKVQDFRAAEEFQLVKRHKGKLKSRDLKQWVMDLRLSNRILTMNMKVDASGSVHPLDAVRAVLGLEKESLKDLKILKTSAGMCESCT
ncbi:MAG: TIGR03960 family B12-binding radical SAM protein [Desulfomonile tiedjei]|uniref:TIGR03960 family B12-binding radical SAM protein n=1 Tax=Desulfomonile tiedjei TaxID=2358 RepID=A0A9D6V501_9BACT|nr:TIGR03960 family B12-binding radical SAM protein [Desulfomonile tiedjei]